MYHELTYKEQKRIRRMRLVKAFFIVLVLALLLAFASFARASSRDQATITVRESILNAAKQCCAVEGSYPSSIEHLEKNYGLVVNREDYVVSYEWFADNILPSVVVTVR